MKRPFSRKLIVIATLSIAINGYLLVAVLTSGWKVIPQQVLFRPQLTFAVRPAVNGLESTLVEYWNIPYQDLISSVSNSNHAVCGFQKGEIALSVLKARDDVIINWPDWTSFALTNPKFGGLKSISIPVVPSPELARFAEYLSQSKAPFGLKGVYVRLQQEKNNQALKAALLRTDEWLAFCKIFNQLSPEASLSIAGEIGWEQFSSCIDLAAKGESIDTQKMLLTWSMQGSQAAAIELVHTYRDQISTVLSDHELIKLLTLLPVEDDATSLLLVTLLKTPRKPHIWNSCRQMLAKRYQDDSLNSLPREELLQKLGVLPSVPVKAPVTIQETIKAKPASKPVVKKSGAQVQSTYIIRKGETLASIAQAMKISLIELKKLNPHLVSAPRLAPGTAVKIPLQNPSRPDLCHDTKVRSTQVVVPPSKKPVAAAASKTSPKRTESKLGKTCSSTPKAGK